MNTNTFCVNTSNALGYLHLTCQLRQIAVIPDHVALENVDAETRAAIEENPAEYVAITPFCAGVNLDRQVHQLAPRTSVLEEEVGKSKIKVIRPQPLHGTNSARRGVRFDKFGPLFIVIGKCTEAAVQLILILRGPLLLSWVIGFFKTEIDDPPEVTARRLCYGAYLGWLKNPKILTLIDRATQGGSKSSQDQRVLDFGLTLEARFLPHPTDPVYVLMVKPCPKNYKLWEEIRALGRTVYIDQLASFSPHNRVKVTSPVADGPPPFTMGIHAPSKSPTPENPRRLVISSERCDRAIQCHKRSIRINPRVVGCIACSRKSIVRWKLVLYDNGPQAVTDLVHLPHIVLHRCL
ncbi:hypothetical protein B0H13DRAFT_2408864 [Mycena leptocephala]|nr:hypothetical protein B0H13DRAFT_2408864 [Mycena leptocephala]